LRLLVDRELSNANSVWDHLDGPAEIKSPDNDGAAACISSKQAAAQGDKDGDAEAGPVLSASMGRI
jgi:hypothetical protein